MSSPAFEALLKEVAHAHKRLKAVQGFCDFATDLQPSSFKRRMIPSGDLMQRDPILSDPKSDPLALAAAKTSQDAFWRQTYSGTDISQDFMDRFGCFCLIGDGGPWVSEQMSAYFVYMPEGLDYPWHEHPAEELYVVLAGEAEFRAEGQATKTLGVGEASFHKSNQPHAMTTHERGIIAYVIWRSNLGIAPVWTDRRITV